MNNGIKIHAIKMTNAKYVACCEWEGKYIFLPQDSGYWSSHHPKLFDTCEEAITSAEKQWT